MQQSLRTFLAVAALMLLAACTSGKTATVLEPTGLFANERDAAIDHSLNHPTPDRLATLRPDMKVEVLSDTYGKDYWACRVRTETELTGWVLCTSLDFHDADGA